MAYSIRRLPTGKGPLPCDRCSACGVLKTDLTLKDRTWTCASCGTRHDRNLNAAINLRDEGVRLLAVGHTDSHNAQGDRVTPGTPGNGR